MRAVLLAALCALATASCALNGQDYRSEDRLRRRAGAFYGAWVRGDVKTAQRLLSHNFVSNDEGLKSFKGLMTEQRWRGFQIASVESELKMRRVSVELTQNGGERRAQVTYWIFERGDWYLDVLD